MKYISIEEYARLKGFTIEEAKAELAKPQYKGKFKDFKGAIIVSDELIKAEPEAEAPAAEVQKKTEVDYLRRQIEELQQRLEARETELKAAAEELRDKNAQIAEFAIRFADLANQAQLLQAAEKKALVAPAAIGEEDEEAPPQKKGFFRRLFGG